MDILYEDNHLIIINKKTSEIVQGDKTGDICLAESIKEYIKTRDNKPGNVFLGVTHRLDRPTSGIVIFAKTSKALSRMNKFFREGQVHKTYHAVVRTCPAKNADTLVHYLVRNRKKNKSFAYDEPRRDSKEGRLSYTLIGSSDKYYLLEIILHTGRHHQIRSQLSRIGSPIRGDLKYGYSRSNPGGGINLHAREVRFPHPVKETEMTITAPYPADDSLWKNFVRIEDEN